jgi:hypothetical protein
MTDFFSLSLFFPLKGNTFRWYIAPSKLANMRQIVDAVLQTETGGERPTLDRLMTTKTVGHDGGERYDFNKLNRSGYAHGHYAAYPLSCTMGFFAFTSRNKGGENVGEASRDWANVRESALFQKRTVYFEKDQMVEKTSEVTFPAFFMPHLKTALDYVQQRLDESMMGAGNDNRALGPV